MYIETREENNLFTVNVKFNHNFTKIGKKN